LLDGVFSKRDWESGNSGRVIQKQEGDDSKFLGVALACAIDSVEE
jgi:hypothetical protein